MSNVVIEVLVIGLLLVANGVFAMTEIAVVTARKSRLRKLAEQGDVRARAALDLAESPNRFFSTVQVGITLVGVLAGAFGGATLSKVIAGALQPVPLLAPYGQGIGIAIVVIGITYFSLIIGELVPKRLAMNNPESIARFLAGPMTRLSVLAGPLVRFLGFSTDLVLRIANIKPRPQEGVSDEEIKLLLQEGVKAGVFHKAEPKMVESVLALDHLPVREIMTPRAKIIFLKRDDPHETVWHKIVVSGHSEFPVYEGTRDNVIGFVSIKAIYAHLAAGIPVRLSDLVVSPLVVPTMQPVMKLLEAFKQGGRRIALVADEFGAIIGLVTLVDVLEAIAGDIPSQEERLRPQARKRDDGTWLVDALIEIEDLERVIPALKFPPEQTRSYSTLAGFILDQVGRVPLEGEFLVWSRYRLEIIDMDRHRIDKVLVYPPPTEPSRSAQL